MKTTDIVFVKGSIEFKSGDHQVKDLIAYSSDEWQKIAGSIIEGDLIITNKDTLVPYSIYCASQGISTYGNYISGLQSPNEVIRIFKEEIENLQKLKKLEISSDLKDVLNRQIYIGVVGTMELFLCDFLYSMVLGLKEYYENFCKYYSSSIKKKLKSNKGIRIQDIVVTIILGTNFHRIKLIDEIYINVLNIKFPASEKLKKQILSRHKLVHRNGIPSKNSEYIRVNDNMIDELISEVKQLVDYIIKTKKIEIDEWFPDPIRKS